MRVTNVPELLEFARSLGAPMREAGDGRTLELVVRAGALEGLLFLRWDGAVVQIVQAMLADVPIDRLPALAEAIARVNHVALLPGFGLDWTSRQVYYRAVVWLTDGGVEGELLERTIRTVVASAREYVLALGGVARGEPADKVIDAAKVAPPPDLHT